VTAAQADAALLSLAKDIFADVVACQVILAEVGEYERRERGKLETVRPYERIFVHEPSLGDPERRLLAASLERQRGFMGRLADDVEVHVMNPSDVAEGFYTPHRIELHPVVFESKTDHSAHRLSNRYVPADEGHTEAEITLAHELGHHVAEMLGEDNAIKAVSHALGIDPPELPADPQKRWSAKYLWWGKAEPKVRKQISLYGKDSLSEAEAELWSEYTMNAEPRKAARRYGKWVRTHLKDQGVL
jgi:hypothetical protein